MQAELLTLSLNPHGELKTAVFTFMIHELYDSYYNSDTLYCLKYDNKKTKRVSYQKHYPRAFRDFTNSGINDYPNYRRRDDDQTITVFSSRKKFVINNW